MSLKACPSCGRHNKLEESSCVQCNSSLLPAEASDPADQTIYGVPFEMFSQQDDETEDEDTIVPPLEDEDKPKPKKKSFWERLGIKRL